MISSKFNRQRTEDNYRICYHGFRKFIKPMTHETMIKILMTSVFHNEVQNTRDVCNFRFGHQLQFSEFVIVCLYVCCCCVFHKESPQNSNNSFFFNTKTIQIITSYYQNDSSYHLTTTTTSAAVTTMTRSTTITTTTTTKIVSRVCSSFRTLRFC